MPKYHHFWKLSVHCSGINVTMYNYPLLLKSRNAWKRNSALQTQTLVMVIQLKITMSCNYNIVDWICNLFNLGLTQTLFTSRHYQGQNTIKVNLLSTHTIPKQAIVFSQLPLTAQSQSEPENKWYCFSFLSFLSYLYLFQPQTICAYNLPFFPLACGCFTSLKSKWKVCNTISGWGFKFGFSFYFTCSIIMIFPVQNVNSSVIWTSKYRTKKRSRLYYIYLMQEDLRN